MRKLIFLIGLSVGYLPLFAQNFTPESVSFQHYQNALKLFQNEQYGAARQSFENYLSRYPQGEMSQHAQYYRAFAAISMDQSDGELLMSRFITEHPSDPKAVRAYYELGNINFQKGEYKEAADYYSQIDTRDLTYGEKMDALYKQGYCYLVEEDYDKALENFNEVKAGESPFFFDASYYAGYIAYQKGDYQEAIADLRLAEKYEKYQLLARR